MENFVYLVNNENVVVALRGIGIYNVVSLKTPLEHTFQWTDLGIQAKRVVILFDSRDEMERTAEILLCCGVSVAVIAPCGKSAEEFVKKCSGSEPFSDYVQDDIQDYIEYLVGELLICELKPAGQIDAIKRIADSIDNIPDGISRQVYLNYLAMMASVPVELLLKYLDDKIPF